MFGILLAGAVFLWGCATNLEENEARLAEQRKREADEASWVMRLQQEMSARERREREEFEAAVKAEAEALEEMYKNPPSFVGTAANFFREYSQNEYAARNKYFGKVIKLTGDIIAFNRSEPTMWNNNILSYSITLQGRREILQFENEHITLDFQEKDLPENVFLNLKKDKPSLP
jgi:CRISPR/Cas system-associated endonuclease Cas1